MKRNIFCEEETSYLEFVEIKLLCLHQWRNSEINDFVCGKESLIDSNNTSSRQNARLKDSNRISLVIT